MAADLFLDQLNVKISHTNVQAEAMITAIAIRSAALSMTYSAQKGLVQTVAPGCCVTGWNLIIGSVEQGLARHPAHLSHSRRKGFCCRALACCA